MSEQTTETVPAWAQHWRATEPKMCPFCGGSASVRAEPDKNSKGVPTGAYHALVACMYCDCRTSYYGAETEEKAKQRAQQIWDERKYATREWGDS